MDLKLVVELVQFQWIYTGKEATPIGLHSVFRRGFLNCAKRKSSTQYVVHDLLERHVQETGALFERLGQIIVQS